MKNKYVVKFIKSMNYEIEANSFKEAEDIAIELNSDKSEDIKWIFKPYEEIIVEEIK